MCIYYLIYTIYYKAQVKILHYRTIKHFYIQPWGKAYSITVFMRYNYETFIHAGDTIIDIDLL